MEVEFEMNPNYVKKFFATQINNAIEKTIKEFLNDLRSNSTIREIEEKWEKKLLHKG